ERARHSSVGISTARPVPREEFLHQHFSVGRDVGSAGSISETTAATGPCAARLSSREKRFHVRHPTRSEIANGEDENAVHNYANEFPKSLLERFPTVGASHRRRMQSSTGRSARERHDQRRNGRSTRVHARVGLARRKSAKVAER